MKKITTLLNVSLFAILFSGNVFAIDITTLNLENLVGSTQSNVTTTFGHVFREGQISSGTTLSARLSGGTSVPLQVNKKATHADGSLRHAIFTARIPTLASGGDTLILSTGGSAPGGSAVTVSNILSSGFDAVVDLNVGGTVYSASAKDLLQNGSPQTWFSGPLASEFLVGGPAKTSGGSEHAHLSVYFHIRAYAGLSQVRVDVVVENNWSFVSGAGNKSYSVDVNVGGVNVFNDSFTHYHHARWHKRFWWGNEPPVYVKHDHDYIQSTRAIPKYEDVSPSNSFLNSVRQSTAPMNNGDHNNNMQDTGFQPGIGPLPQWDAVYAISADRRAFNYMLANADGGGAYGVHYRDEDTGYPISIDNYPNATIADPAASSPSWPNASGSSPYYEGNWSSHQPSMGFLPYIVTGDYYYLEEAQFWTSYNLIWPSARSRNYSSGWWYTDSLRGQAWAYRSLAQVAYITPDDHAMKAYYEDKLASNLSHDHALYVSPGGPDKNNLGAMYMGEGNQEYRFYDYFMSWTVQYMVDLGFTQAIPFRDYKLKFPIGIMGINAGEYCFQVSAQYTWEVGPNSSDFYNNWGEVYAAMFPNLAGIQCGSAAMASKLGVSLNEITADQFSTTYYYANLQPAVAAAADSGLPGGQEAWDRANLSGVHPDYSDEPIWGVVPHNLTGLSMALSASPQWVDKGDSTTLSWNAPSDSTCTASVDWSGSKPTSGSETISNIQSDKQFTLTCTNSSGSSSRTIYVLIGTPGVGGGGGGNNSKSGDGSGSGSMDWLMLVCILLMLSMKEIKRKKYLLKNVD